MGKLFHVTVCYELVVVADSESDAERWASSNMDEVARTDNPHVNIANEIGADDGLPPDWNNSCLPWGANDNKTVGEYRGHPRPTRGPLTVKKPTDHADHECG